VCRGRCIIPGVLHFARRRVHGRWVRCVLWNQGCYVHIRPTTTSAFTTANLAATALSTALTAATLATALAAAVTTAVTAAALASTALATSGLCGVLPRRVRVVQQQQEG